MALRRAASALPYHASRTAIAISYAAARSRLPAADARIMACPGRLPRALQATRACEGQRLNVGQRLFAVRLAPGECDLALHAGSIGSEKGDVIRVDQRLQLVPARHRLAKRLFGVCQPTETDKTPHP
jgi:hypothetical protein